MSTTRGVSKAPPGWRSARPLLAGLVGACLCLGLLPSTAEAPGHSVGLLQVKAAYEGDPHHYTWPYSRTSTAYNVDYALAWRRACFEGYFAEGGWLPYTSRGDFWGCVGLWYSGQWHTRDAEYVAEVRQALTERPWVGWGWPGYGSPPRAPFRTLDPGSALPSGEECAGLVRRDPWEPSSENYPENDTTGVPLVLPDDAWHGFDSWRQLARRVDGGFTGTTDEIIQWASCKWGFDEDLTRAQAYVESNWSQEFRGDVAGSPRDKL